MKSEKITLGRVVVAARRQRGLSQAELAKHLRDQMGSLACDPGFDFRHLSKIEPRIALMCAIALSIALSTALLNGQAQLGIVLTESVRVVLTLPKRYDLFKGLKKSYRKRCEASLQSA